RKTERSERLAASDRNKIFLLLLFSAEAQDWIADDGVCNANDDADGSVRVRNLFERDGVSDCIEACAAPLFRNNHSQKSKLCKPTQLLAREARLFVIFMRTRRNLARHKLAHISLHHSLLF